MTGNTRKRILLLLEFLYNTTDQDHPTNTRDLMNHLIANGIIVDRKTLREDMEVLTEAGYDIVMVKSSPNKYFWGDRVFEVPELKMMLDAVSSSRFISRKKSDILMEKIASLAGKPQSLQLKRHSYALDKTKTDNKNIYYIVDIITDAINKMKKIAFHYTEYNGRKEKILRNNGEVYVLSPYALYCNAGYYYVVGYSDKRKDVVVFRVDRLHKPEILDEESVAKPEGFQIQDYENKIFNMFDGEESVVELLCENSLMKYIVDRFGVDVKTEERSGNTFVTTVSANLSPTFYSWIFQFGGGIRILSPLKAVAEFHEICLKNIQSHKGQ